MKFAYRRRNTTKSGQNRSESLGAGLWVPCRLFWAWFGARKRRFPARSVKMCGPLLPQPILAGSSGTWTGPKIGPHCRHRPRPPLCRHWDPRAIETHGYPKPTKTHENLQNIQKTTPQKPSQTFPKPTTQKTQTTPRGTGGFHYPGPATRHYMASTPPPLAAMVTK